MKKSNAADLRKQIGQNYMQMNGKQFKQWLQDEFGFNNWTEYEQASASPEYSHGPSFYEWIVKQINKGGQ